MVVNTVKILNDCHNFVLFWENWRTLTYFRLSKTNFIVRRNFNGFREKMTLSCEILEKSKKNSFFEGENRFCILVIAKNVAESHPFVAEIHFSGENSIFRP